MPYAIITYANGQTGFRAINPDDELAPGETFATDPPLPSMADVAAQLEDAVQAWLDTTAKTNGYTSLERCVSFFNSSVAQYAKDAAAALAWRDAVWPACFAWQQQAMSQPPAVLPTAAEVIATLPQPEQFGWTVHAPGATG